MIQVTNNRRLYLLIFVVFLSVTVDIYGSTCDIILSTSKKASLGGLSFRNGDLAKYDPVADTASLFPSESLFSRNVDIDAVSLLANGNIILSTKSSATLGGLRFRDGDLVEYNPNTRTASLFFSESLFSRNVDIDAVDILANGNIILSTARRVSLGGLYFKDGDLVEYDPIARTASLFFSESRFSHHEDIDAVDVLPDGTILLSTKSRAKLGGLSFQKNDLVRYNPQTDMATLYPIDSYFQTCGNIDAVEIIPEPSTLLLLGSGAVIGIRKLKVQR
jgi:hypothetical protein